MTVRCKLYTLESAADAGGKPEPVTLGYASPSRVPCTGELLRVRGGEVLLDPFNGGVTLDREKLGTPPRMGGLAAEDPRIADAVSDTEVLLRLQNNLKQRAAQSGEHGRALDIAKRMVLLGPRRTELWLELARLQEGAGSLGAAKKAYEAAMALSKAGDASLNEAALALHALKRRLN